MKRATRIIVVDNNSLMTQLCRALRDTRARVDRASLPGLPSALEQPAPTIVVCVQVDLDAVLQVAREAPGQVRVVTVLDPELDLPRAGRGLLQVALPHDCSIPNLVTQIRALAAWGMDRDDVETALATPRSVATSLEAGTVEPDSQTRTPPLLSREPGFARHARRVSLRPSAQTRRSGRVLVRSKNVNRAEFIAEMMREAGYMTQAECEPPTLSDWPALRKFEPHAIVVHELDCVRDDGAWLHQLRRDPFLRTVTSLTFDFDKASAQARSVLSPVLCRLEGIIRTEDRLLADLTEDCDVECQLYQVSLPRLLRRLAESGRDIRLFLAERGVLLRWAVRAGGVTEALLDGSQRKRLSETAALKWALAHPKATVVLRAASSLKWTPRCSLDELLGHGYRNWNVPSVPRPVVREIAPLLQREPASDHQTRPEA